MKDVKVIDLETLDIKKAIFDETIFILHEHRQAQNGYAESGGELRCMCRPLKTITSKTLREMLSNIHEYKAIKIEL